MKYNEDKDRIASPGELLSISRHNLKILAKRRGLDIEKMLFQEVEAALINTVTIGEINELLGRR